MYHSRSAIWVSNFDFFPLHLLSSLSSLISDFFRLPSSPSSLLVTLTWLPQRRHSRSLTRVVRTWLNWVCLTQIRWLMALLFRWVTQCLCYMCYYVLFGLYAFAYELLTFGCAIVGLCNTCASKGTTFEDVISMVKEVIPELSCPVSLFTYYNPILKRGIPNFMTIVKEAGLRGNISFLI